MSDITTTVQEVGDIATTVQEVDFVTTSTGLYNPSTATRLVELTDVDVSSYVDGSILVYKATAHKWTSTTSLNAQTMEGGEY